MKALYGVVGVGMGHAMRSRAVIDYLLECGYEFMVVASGRAYDFLSETYSGTEKVSVVKIRGFKFIFNKGAVSQLKTALNIMVEAPKSIQTNLKIAKQIIDKYDPDVVFSDFESMSGWYARSRSKPLICIDNIHFLDRCHHLDDLEHGSWLARILTLAVVKLRVTGANHYFITSPFTPKPIDEKTTMIGPILRKELLTAQPSNCGYILVYYSLDDKDALVEELLKSGERYVFYGSDEDKVLDNITFKKFSDAGFIHDLVNCKGLISTAGSSLMSEAIYLGKPMLSLPIKNQYEQTLNAAYLENLELGCNASVINQVVLNHFIEGIPTFSKNINYYLAAHMNMSDAIGKIKSYVDSFRQE